MEEARLRTALNIIAANLAFPEENMILALVEQGYTHGEANRLAAFVQRAFARPVLERLGVANFSNVVSVPTEGGEFFTAYLDRQPEYVTALTMARKQMLSPTIDAQIFKAIVGSSAEIATVSRALDAGADVSGGAISSALIGTSYAEHILR